MQSGYKYINAVAAELIEYTNWLPVQVDGEQAVVILAKKEGELLKLIFLTNGENNRWEPGDSSPAIREYMRKINCTHTRLAAIYIFEEEITADNSVESNTAGDIEVLKVYVNLKEGRIYSSGLEQSIQDVFTKYLEMNVLEDYKPVDLRSVRKPEVRPRPTVTWMILLVNFVMWGLMTLAGGSTDTGVLIKFGAMYGPLIIEGEYWRLITAVFLHVGIMHLIFNSYALYQLGSLAEIVYGRKRFVLIYFAAGITGSVFSFLFTRSVSAGASGAIFGLLGALLYFGRKKKGVFRKGFISNIIAIILINLFIGFTYPGIDNFAHIGGLVGGYISGYFAGTDSKSRFTLRQYAYLGILAVFVLSMLGVGNLVYQDDNQVMYYRARQHVEEGRFMQADSLLEDIMNRLPEEDELGIEARYLYAYSRARQGDIKTAIEYAQIVVENYPDSHNAHLLLGALYIEKGEMEEARAHLNKALRLNPDSEDAKELLDEL